MTNTAQWGVLDDLVSSAAEQQLGPAADALPAGDDGPGADLGCVDLPSAAGG